MRMVFMAYVSDSKEAVDFYCKALNATSKNCFRANDDDDFWAHAEIVIDNKTVLAISDVLHYETSFNTDFKTENNMQFWLSFPDEASLETAYDVLRENAEIHYPLDSCEWCRKMTDLTDVFGIRWLLVYDPD